VAPLDSAPVTVYALRLGNTFFYDPGDENEASVLKLFTTPVECAVYKMEIGAPGLKADIVFLEDVWAALKHLAEESMRHFRAPLRVAVYRDAGRVAEVLWDSAETIH
jgi:hypothetical protein